MKNNYTVSQAAAYLGVTRQKIHQLLKDGALTYGTNPMDKRNKLIPIADLDRLKEYIPSTQEEPIVTKPVPEINTPPTEPAPTIVSKTGKIAKFTSQHKEIAKLLNDEFGGGARFGWVKTTMMSIPGWDNMSHEELRRVFNVKQK